MRGETILVVDDEQLIRWSLRKELTRAGFAVSEAATKGEAIDLLRKEEPDLVILDQRLPDGEGIDVLKVVVEEDLKVAVIMLTVIDRSDTAVKAMKLGAFDYISKPVEMEELKIVIDKALEATRLKRQVSHLLKQQKKQYGFCGMIGSSPAMQDVFDRLAKIAGSQATTVLITGETGTGKELAAKAIHFLSARRGKPLMTVNCAAMPDQLIESELFGHEKGAFTDAKTQKKGILELAQGGTVFLDEIGDISSALQSKILRVLENKTFKRVGGTVEIAADVRFISATNQPLEQRLSEGKFRRDLYYRLDVVHVHIPPLRERGEDVLLLSQYFLEELNGMFHKNFKGLSDEVKSLFLRYEWPGNVRELRNVLERAVLLSDDEFVTLPHIELAYSRLAPGESQTFQLDFESKDFSMDQLEKKILLHALEKTGGNQSQAARLLKISRDTLRYRMKKHNLLKK